MEQGNDKLELVYGVEDKPSPMESAYAALQHFENTTASLKFHWIN